MSDSDEKVDSHDSYFDEYQIHMAGNLTGKIRLINNDINNDNKWRGWREIKNVFGYIVKHYFDGIDPREMKTSYEFNTHQVVIDMHAVNCSINGSFQDYLLRRIICEKQNNDFHDIRANDIVNSFEGESVEKEKLRVCVHNTTDISKKCFKITKDIFLTSICHSMSFGHTISDSCKKEFCDYLDSHGVDLVSEYRKTIDEFIAEDEFVIHNPVVGGYIEELGRGISADGDLIVGDCFYDIKASKQKAFFTEEEYLLQVLGYVALMKNTEKDFSDHKITKVGIINVYNGTRVVYDISTLTDEHFMNLLKIFTGMI